MYTAYTWTFPVSLSKDVVATFTPEPPPLPGYYRVYMRIMTGQGTVSGISLPYQDFREGSQVNLNLVASPAANYRVVRWTLNGAIHGTANTTNVNIPAIDQNHEIRIYFEPITHAISVTIETTGVGTGGEVRYSGEVIVGSREFQQGRSIRLDIIEFAGYRLVEYQITGLPSVAGVSYIDIPNINSDVNVIIRFMQTHRVTVSAVTVLGGVGGSYTWVGNQPRLGCPSYTFDHGTDVSLRITANTNNEF